MSKKPYRLNRTHFILILYVLFIGSLSLFQSRPVFAKTDFTQYADRTSQQSTPPAAGTYVPNELIVHFKKNCAPHTVSSDWACAEPQKNVRMHTIQTLLRRIGVAIGLTSEQIDYSIGLNNKLSKIDQEYNLVESTRMYDEDDALDSHPYIFRFEEGTSLEKARLAYENVFEVSYVQYHYIYTLQ